MNNGRTEGLLAGSDDTRPQVLLLQWKQSECASRPIQWWPSPKRQYQNKRSQQDPRTQGFNCPARRRMGVASEPCQIQSWASKSATGSITGASYKTFLACRRSSKQPAPAVSTFMQQHRPLLGNGPEMILADCLNRSTLHPRCFRHAYEVEPRPVGRQTSRRGTAFNPESVCQPSRDLNPPCSCTPAHPARDEARPIYGELNAPAMTAARRMFPDYAPPCVSRGAEIIHIQTVGMFPTRANQKVNSYFVQAATYVWVITRSLSVSGVSRHTVHSAQLELPYVMGTLSARM